MSCDQTKMASTDFEAKFEEIWEEVNLLSERDSLTVSTLACHAGDPGSNPARGDDFFN